MKNRYSQLDLLNRRLSRKNGSTSLLDVIKTVFAKNDYISIGLYIPYYDYLRGEVLLQDIMELTTEEVSNLSVEGLIKLLYVQYLKQVMKGDIPLEKIGKRLVKMVNDVYATELEDLQPVDSNTLVLKPRKTGHTTKQWKYIEITMKEHYLFRGEIMLKDISEEYGIDFDFSIEDVIVALYCDFIKEIKKGHTVDTINNILASFSSYDVNLI